MKVDGSVKSLIQGVSQQPRQIRLPGQCSLQENMSSNPLIGLTRRPPLERRGDLCTSTGTVDYFEFNINNIKYHGVVTPGFLKIFQHGTLVQDLALTTAVQTYLDSGNLCTLSIDDTTYIASRNVVTTLTADTAVSSGKASIINLLGGQYGRTFSVTVNWGSVSVTAQYSTPDGSTASHVYNVATSYIATQLATGLAGITTNSFNTLFSVTRVEDVIKISSSTVTDFYCTVSDGEGGTLIKACNNSVESASDLPRFAPNGYTAIVAGLGGTATDNYYVKFYTSNDTVAVGAGFGQAGTWYEDVAQGLQYKLDANTMPIGLQYHSDTDEFEVGVVAWGERACGDDVTNPVPSFVGHKINDLGYFQGRMLIVSDQSVVLSRTSLSANSSRVTDFWRETATTSTDSDVIDMQSTASNVGALYHATPHNRDMIVFSEGAQFIILGRSTLTPSNCSLILTTTFNSDLSAKPTEAGRNVFFGEANGIYTNVREFYTLDSIDANDARPITQHCSEYITGGLKQFVGSSNYDLLLVLTNSTKVFVYEYLWINSDKVQSSWGTWILPFAPERAWMEGDTVFFIRKVLNGSEYLYTLFSMRLDVQADTGLEYCVHLDYKAEASMVNGVITIPVPDPSYQYNIVYIQGEDLPNPGMRLLPDSSVTADGEITVDFDMPSTSGTVLYGIRFKSRYRPTMPVIKDADGVAVGTGKFRVTQFILNCVNAGKLWYKKLSPFRNEPEYQQVTSRYASDPRTVVGTEALVTKQYLVPFRDDPSVAELEFMTEEHTPMTINNLEWLGEYHHTRSRMQGNK